MSFFPKELTHGFGPKMAIFQLFFLGNVGQENVFYDILERKNAFLGYKNKKFKSSKNWHFSKVVNPRFWSKKWLFFRPFFFLRQARKMSYTIFLERKNDFLCYKNKKFKKSKNWDFSKRVNTWFWYKNSHFSIIFFRQYSQENVFFDILQHKNAFLGYKKKKFKKSKN